MSYDNQPSAFDDAECELVVRNCGLDGEALIKVPKRKILVHYERVLYLPISHVIDDAMLFFEHRKERRRIQ